MVRFCDVGMFCNFYNGPLKFLKVGKTTAQSCYNPDHEISFDPYEMVSLE